MSRFDPADSGYVDVAARLVEFRTQYPDGSLQPANLDRPYDIVTIGGEEFGTFIVVVAAAYRWPGDARPGVGMAYEPYPGKTPYTRGSELQNAETSAWGRAIVAALAADTKRGVASADEVRAQQDRQENPLAERASLMANGRGAIAAAQTETQLAHLSATAVRLHSDGKITDDDAAELEANVQARRQVIITGGQDPQTEQAGRARNKITKGKS